MTKIQSVWHVFNVVLPEIGFTFSTATWKCSSLIGWAVVLEKTAWMWICRGTLGTRRATKSIRSCELSTCTLFVEGRTLLGGSEDAKFHSSSSAAGACPVGCGCGGELTSPAKSSSVDDGTGAPWP